MPFAGRKQPMHNQRKQQIRNPFTNPVIGDRFAFYDEYNKDQKGHRDYLEINDLSDTVVIWDLMDGQFLAAPRSDFKLMEAEGWYVYQAM